MSLVDRLDAVSQFSGPFEFQGLGRGEHFGLEVLEDFLRDECDFGIGPGGLLHQLPGLDLLLDPSPDRLLYRLGRDAVFGVVGELRVPSPGGLVDGLLHAVGDVVGVEDDFGVDVSCRASDGLDQAGGTAEEPFLVGIEDGDERDFGQIESFPEQVDSDDHVVGLFAECSQHGHPFDGVEFRVQPCGADALVLEIPGEVF